MKIICKLFGHKYTACRGECTHGCCSHCLRCESHRQSLAIGLKEANEIFWKYKRQFDTEYAELFNKDYTKTQDLTHSDIPTVDIKWYNKSHGNT